MTRVKYQGPVTIYAMVDPEPRPSLKDQENALPKRDKNVQICQSDEMFTWVHALATILVINEKASAAGSKEKNAVLLTGFFGIIGSLFQRLWDQAEMRATLETDDNFEIVASTIKTIYDQTCRSCGLINRMIFYMPKDGKKVGKLRIDHKAGDTPAKQKWLRPDKRQSEDPGPVSDKRQKDDATRSRCQWDDRPWWQSSDWASSLSSSWRWQVARPSFLATLHLYKPLPERPPRANPSRFMADTQDYSFIEKYARYGKEQHLSHQHFYGYHDGARAAMLAFASPVVKSLPYERAKRLVDLHKLDDIKKSREAHRFGSEEPAVPDENDDKPLSLLEEAEEEAEGDEGKVVFWDRRRDRRRRRRVFEAVVKVVKDVAKEAEKVVEDVVKAVESALSCAGQAGTFASTGYTRSINGNVAWSIGLSAGPENVFQELLNGKLPLDQISLGAGFSVGSNTDVWWAGAGFGGSITCKPRRGMFGIKKPGQCKLDMTVATLACGNVPTSHSACPMGRNFAGMTCSESGGYFVSIMCCSFDLSNGKNSCD
ncbi:unnamed protein product [Symbiodinium sp. KB8]|nr:unnamed protein product [Symbiodinium sp. KB8]